MVGERGMTEKMDKAVLISIRPKWCDLIFRGEKTMEVRKSFPKLDAPFRAIVYCTKAKTTDENFLVTDKTGYNWLGNGKVIGEFICTGYDEFTPTDGGVKFKRFMALHDLSVKELKEYLRGKIGYGWRISNLEIYDAPKDLIEFRLIRAPQSWCYVELIGGNEWEVN